MKCLGVLLGPLFFNISLIAQKQSFPYPSLYPQYLSPIPIGNSDSLSITSSSTSFNFDKEKRGQTDVSIHFKLPRSNWSFGVNYFRLNEISTKEFTNSMKASNRFELMAGYQIQLSNNAQLGVGAELGVFQRQGVFQKSYIGDLEPYRADFGLGLAYQVKDFNLYLGIESVLSDDRTFTVVGGLVDSLFFVEKDRNVYLFATNKTARLAKIDLVYAVYLSSLRDGLLQIGIEDKNDISQWTAALMLVDGSWGWQFSGSAFVPKKKKLQIFFSYNILFENFKLRSNLGFKYRIL